MRSHARSLLRRLDQSTKQRTSKWSLSNSTPSNCGLLHRPRTSKTLLGDSRIASHNFRRIKPSWNPVLSRTASLGRSQWYGPCPSPSTVLSVWQMSWKRHKLRLGQAWRCKTSGVWWARTGIWVECPCKNLRILRRRPLHLAIWSSKWGKSVGW